MKKVYNSVYAYKYYFDIPDKIKDIVSGKSWSYEIVKHNLKTNIYSFIKCPNFDRQDEPEVGDSLSVFPDETYKIINSNYQKLYHHRWMFVEEDYNLFDYDRSKERTKIIKYVIKKHNFNIYKISNKDYWQKVVDLVDKELFEETECRCDRCVEMCKVKPCCGTPEEIKKIIEYGWKSKLAIETHDNIEMLAPSIEGSEGTKMSWGQTGRCVFLKNNLCDLQTKHIGKPMEGRIAHHDKKYNGIDIKGYISSKWLYKEAKDLVKLTNFKD